MNNRQSFVDLVNELYTERRETASRRLVHEFKTKKDLINLLVLESSSNKREDEELKSNEFINLLINLPQITSNIFQLLNDLLFVPETYFKTLCSIIYASLIKIHCQLANGENQDLSIITELIGKLCFNKHDDIYWTEVGSKLVANSKHDLIWRKIGRRIVKQQNTLYLESLIRQLLLNLKSWQELSWYLDANELNDSEHNENKVSERSSKSQLIKYFLTNKFLLVIHFPSKYQNLIDNILGFLINNNELLFENTLHNVISVFSNATLVRHQTRNQHDYLSRILICGLKYAKQSKLIPSSSSFRSLVMHCAETHLRMVEIDKRNRGLFVVQNWSNYLNDSQSIESLDFEIETNDEIQFLVDILENRSTSFEDKTVKKMETISNDSDIEDLNNKTKTMMNYDEDEEDEDDLKPYDMSNDTPLITTKRPIYLKDALEGLINTEDAEYNSTCLEFLSELIEKNKSQASELAVDFLRVLLFLEIEELKKNRFEMMVKFCCINPLQSARYLTSQVYEQNLSIVRKLDVLDVIVECARELSTLDHHKSIENESKVKSIQNIVQRSKPAYEKIIEDRIKAKTKILCSSHKMPLESSNQFVPLVAHFFYPLINNYDKKGITLNFNEDDYFVLGRLMFALAELLKTVGQTHVTHKMATSLIEFLIAFKHHQEAYVRKAITMCIHSILTNVPNFFLFENLLDHILSLRDFLLDLKQLDPETFCSHGVITLYVLQEQINDYEQNRKLKIKN